MIFYSSAKSYEYDFASHSFFKRITTKIKTMLWIVTYDRCSQHYSLSYTPYTILISQVSELIIHTDDTSRQIFFLDTFLSHEVPLMFVGNTGTGKSAITNNYLVKLPKEKWVVVLYHFTSSFYRHNNEDAIIWSAYHLTILPETNYYWHSSNGLW